MREQKSVITSSELDNRIKNDSYLLSGLGMRLNGDGSLFTKLMQYIKSCTVIHNFIQSYDAAKHPSQLSHGFIH